MKKTPVKMEQAPAVKTNPDFRKLFEYLEPIKDEEKLILIPEIGTEENKIEWSNKPKVIDEDSDFMPKKDEYTSSHYMMME
jgi:hypothetical protein